MLGMRGHSPKMQVKNPAKSNSLSIVLITELYNKWECLDFCIVCYHHRWTDLSHQRNEITVITFTFLVHLSGLIDPLCITSEK